MTIRKSKTQKEVMEVINDSPQILRASNEYTDIRFQRSPDRIIETKIGGKKEIFRIDDRYNRISQPFSTSYLKSFDPEERLKKEDQLLPFTHDNGTIIDLERRMDAPIPTSKANYYFDLLSRIQRLEERFKKEDPAKKRAQTIEHKKLMKLYYGEDSFRRRKDDYIIFKFPIKLIQRDMIKTLSEGLRKFGELIVHQDEFKTKEIRDVFYRGNKFTLDRDDSIKLHKSMSAVPYLTLDKVRSRKKDWGTETGWFKMRKWVKARYKELRKKRMKAEACYGKIGNELKDNTFGYWKWRKKDPPSEDWIKKLIYLKKYA